MKFARGSTRGSAERGVLKGCRFQAVSRITFLVQSNFRKDYTDDYTEEALKRLHE